LHGVEFRKPLLKQVRDFLIHFLSQRTFRVQGLRQLRGSNPKTYGNIPRPVCVRGDAQIGLTPSCGLGPMQIRRNAARLLTARRERSANSRL
jgi:hypothetical protein